LHSADPTVAAAALAQLVQWTEAFARTVLVTSGAGAKDLNLLLEACTLLASLPQQAGKREEWYALAGRAVAAMPADDWRRFCNTQLRFTQGRASLARGDLAAARACLERALEDDPAPDVEPFALYTLAETERLSGAWTKALQILDRTESLLLDPAGNQDLLTQCKLIRAQAEINLGLPDLAWESLSHVSTTAMPQLQAAARQIEVDLLLAVDRPESAVRRLDELAAAQKTPLSPALQLRRAIARTDMECIAPGVAPEAPGELDALLKDAALSAGERCVGHVALMDFHLRRDEDDNARRHLEGARAELTRPDQGRSSGSTLREQAEIEAYASFLMRRGEFDQAARREQLAALRKAFNAFLAQLRGNEMRPGGVGFLHFAGRRFILNELIVMSIEVEGAELGFDQGLQALIQAQELGSLSRSLSRLLSLSRQLGFPPTTTAMVRRLLNRPEGGTLVFLPDFHRTLVLALDASGASLCEEAVPRSEWLRAVELWTGQVTAPPAAASAAAREGEPEDLRRKGEQVLSLVLPPAIRKRMQGWKSVTIVGADMMEGLPFEALPILGESLGTRLAVDHAPSLPVAVRLAARRALRGRPPPETAGLWLVAAPFLKDQGDPRFSRLAAIPFGDEQRLALQCHYPKLAMSWFVGKDATRDALEDPRMALAEVLQITAHGTELKGRERHAALVLTPASAGDDGLLDCEEVELLSVPDTVVLSACGAARGETRYGEDGLQHLGGAFHMAGASCVVLSSHPVEAQAMQALMEVFHQRLCSGDTRAEAMRAARAALVSRNPRYSHPFYHSLVQVVGLGQLPMGR